MAGGWTRDGAVNDQIEASIADELSRLKTRATPVGDSFTHCAECEEPRLCKNSGCCMLLAKTGGMHVGLH